MLIIYTYIHTYTHIHTYIHTYIQTHIHTYIHIAKAYRRVSNEALFIITGLTPISIKIDAAQLYHLIRGSRHKDPFIDHDKNAKHWLHPATKTTVLDDNTIDSSSIQIFTDGSKSEH